MQVALLNTEWYPRTGGGVVHVENLARRLAVNHDCDVDILTKDMDGSEHERPSLPKSVSVRHIAGTDTGWRVMNELRYSIGVLRRIRTTPYDVVHAHTNTATFPLQVARLFDTPGVVTVHGADLDLSVTFTGSLLDLPYTYIRRMLLKHFRYDGVISVSNELKAVLEQYHANVWYVPNGVTVKEFPAPDQKFRKNILFVGRLRPKKNPLDIVRAFTRLYPNHPDSHLHVVGTGPLREELDTEIEEAGIGDAVTIYGKVSDDELFDLYDRCSIFVLPSDWEGHPLVLLEAWASGLVVVGSNVEGIREFLEGNDYAELFERGDVSALANIIESLFSDEDLTLERGQKARSYVATNYDWNRTAKQTYQIYKSLCTGEQDAIPTEVEQPSVR